jgi:penicillin-binding protein 1A
VTAEPRRGRGWRAAAAALVGLLLIGAAAAALVAKAFIDSVPPLPDKASLLVAHQSPGLTFEDHQGHIIATRGPKHGHLITLAELSPYVTHAFLAAEDRRFYQHGAIDLHGIARAIRTNLAAGHIVQGGSTLTQQLAKTLFLTPDQTLRRKLQEAVIAWRLEQAMSKDEVLALYLNRIFFGDNAYGIDAAAETYFGKPASRLTIQEAALLAALPKAPTRLALTNDMDGALARSRLILATMAHEGWITPAQEAAALAAPPKLAADAPGEGDFGYVLDMAASKATQIAGESAPDLVIRLSIDTALQSTAQGLVRQTVASDGKRGGFHQGALVLIAPDGAIRALVGGADHRLSAYNRAVQAQRQPGSSFKPIIYAAALEEGAKPGDTREDAPLKLGNWTPTNYGGGYRGPVTLANALALSINTIAVRLASEVGADKIGEIAHRFGIKDIPDRPDLSVALGAYEVNLLELTSAFQVFQQGGLRTEPYLVEQVGTARGQILYARVATAGISVYDQAHAADMVKMMEGVIAHGTGVRAAIDRPAAGKTGTSQNWRDAWFIGFTPDWICGVWVGNDDGAAMYKVTGGEIPAAIWRQMMLAAHAGMPPRDFDWFAHEAPGADDQALFPDSGAPESEAATADHLRGAFYGGLEDDFDRARDGASPDVDGPEPDDAKGPVDRAPPPDYTPPPGPDGPAHDEAQTPRPGEGRQ